MPERFSLRINGKRMEVTADADSRVGALLRLSAQSRRGVATRQ